MFEAAAGFAALSTQLEIGRWEDHVRRMDDRRHASAMDALFRQEFINTYNHLVDKHNALLRDVRRYEQEMRGAVDQRDRRIAQLEQEMAQLRAELDTANATVRIYVEQGLRDIRSGR